MGGVGSVSGALGMGGCLMSHLESSEVIMSYFILFVSAIKMIFILSNLRIEAVFSGILNGHDPWRISITSVDPCALSSQRLFCCPRMTWRRGTLGSSSRVENGFCRHVRSPLRSLIPGAALGELHLIPGADIFSVTHLLLWV